MLNFNAAKIKLVGSKSIPWIQVVAKAIDQQVWLHLDLLINFDKKKDLLIN